MGIGLFFHKMLITYDGCIIVQSDAWWQRVTLGGGTWRPRHAAINIILVLATYMYHSKIIGKLDSTLYYVSILFIEWYMLPKFFL